MRNKLMSASLIALLAVGLSACGFSVSGGSGGGGDNGPTGGGDGGKPAPIADKVKGIEIEGRWVSDCVEDTMSFDPLFVKFDVTFEGRRVLRKSPQYLDSQCTQLKEDRAWPGNFHFEAELKNGIYQLGYHFDSGGLTGDNIKLDSKGLWISDRRIGEGMIPDILLKKVATATPVPPQPEPGPAPAPPSNGPIVLKSGDYNPQGQEFPCSVNVGVGKQNGVVFQIMTSFDSNCSNRSYTVPCEGNVCVSENGGFQIKFLSETSFELKLGGGTTEIYNRR